MNRWMHIGSIVVGTSIVSFGYSALASSQSGFIGWLNTVFVVALIYLVCSAGTVFVYSPPFQRLAYNFTYFFSKLKREKEMADEVERKDRSYQGDELEDKARPEWTSSIFVSGVFLAAISMILSIISM